MDDALSHAQNWIAKPFSEDMSVVRWALFVGLVLVLLVMWRIILHHIETALT
jgi:hypothetical protein